MTGTKQKQTEISGGVVRVDFKGVEVSRILTDTRTEIEGWVARAAKSVPNGSKLERVEIAFTQRKGRQTGANVKLHLSNGTVSGEGEGEGMLFAFRDATKKASAQVKKSRENGKSDSGLHTHFGGVARLA